MTTNQYGLSRTIPPDVRYKIRKAAGFGCVGCGVAIIEYEHIEPEFVDAKVHDPAKMTILCAQCHTKVTRKYLSKETVWKWKESPWSLQKGHCHESFDIGTDEFTLWIGGSRSSGVENLLTIDDDIILSVKAPEESGAPFRLSATFHDAKDDLALKIEDNEWTAVSSSFDVLCEGGKVGVRTPDGFALKLLCLPPGAIVVEKVNMMYKGLTIAASRDGLRIENPKGGITSFGSGCIFSADRQGRSLFSYSLAKPGVTLGEGISMTLGGAGVMPSLPERSVSVPPNADCPCGSGKKYKKCHSPQYNYRF